MAEICGNTTNSWRDYLTYTTSQDGFYVYVNVSGGGFQSIQLGVDLSSVTITANVAGTSWSGSGSVYTAYGSTTKVNLLGSKTVKVARGRSAQNVGVSATIDRSSAGYRPGKSTASATVAVPALESHTVSYDANGGSGAPSSQTKWYGSVLTLSATRPTRANHTFQGWATSSGGSVAYQPGASYGADANVTLYAVWTLDLVAPTITSVSAFRCDGTGAATNDGTYAKVSCAWTLDKTATVKSVTATLTPRDGSAAISKAMTVSGSTASVVTSGVSVSTAYDVRVTVTDSNGLSSSASAIVAPTFVTLSLAEGGNGMGIGQRAPSSGLAIAMDTSIDGGATFNGSVWIQGHELRNKDVTVLVAGVVSYYVINSVVTVVLNGRISSKALGPWEKKTLATMPSGYAPKIEVCSPVNINNLTSASNVQFCVQTNGMVVVKSMGTPQGLPVQDIHATLTYAI